MNGLIPRSTRRRVLAAPLALLLLAGCVERTVTIRTQPEGARVILNDQDVGLSPVKVPFTWYGDYDIIVRKKGYETLSTNRNIKAPWYQWPFLDLWTECFIPFTIHDDRELDTFVLAPAQHPDRSELIRNADQMREQAAIAP